MNGIRVIRTKGTNYSIAVNCAMCGGELIQKNKNGEDRYYRVYALYCDHCRTTFSLSIALRTEITSHKTKISGYERGSYHE